MSWVFVPHRQQPPHAFRRPEPDDDQIFYRMLALAAAVHAVAVIVLQVAVPVPTRDLEAPRFALSRPLESQHEAHGVSPEPQRRLDWVFNDWLAPDVRLRSTFDIDPQVMDRLRQAYRHALILFPTFAGEKARPAGPLEIRVIDRDVLNDPTVFDLDEDGRVLGLYFPSAEIAYLTPATFDEPAHLVHELTHFLYHAYDIDLDVWAEEHRVQRFANQVKALEWSLRRPHRMHAEPTAIGGPSFKVRHELQPKVALVAQDFVGPARADWARGVLDAVVEVFPSLAGVEPQEVEPLELRVLSTLPHCTPKTVAGTACGLRYWLSPSGITTSRSIYGDADTLAHALGHVLVSQYQLTLTTEEEELLTTAVAQAARHRLTAAALVGP